MVIREEQRQTCKRDAVAKKEGGQFREMSAGAQDSRGCLERGRCVSPMKYLEISGTRA